MAGASSFWDRLAARYARQPIKDEAAYQTKLARTRAYFSPDTELFEFGCGTGSTAIAHAPYVKHIRATDFSEKMLEIARGKAAQAGVENITFERADIETLQGVDDTYDVVLGLSILHLLENRDAVIAKVHAMLKPGGVFISSTACLGDTMKFFKVLGPLGQRIGLLPQLDVMTRTELVESLERAGFSIEHQWQPGKGRAVFLIARKATEGR